MKSNKEFTQKDFGEKLRNLLKLWQTNAQKLMVIFKKLDGKGSGSDPIFLHPKERNNFIENLAEEIDIDKENMLALYSLYVRFYQGE